MNKCEICGFEAKSEFGLKVHQRKHEKQETPTEKTIVDLVVPGTGEVLLTYSLELHGKDWIVYATNMAKRKGWEMRFR